MEVIKARICIKRAGKEYEQCRREVDNGCVSCSREYLQYVSEAIRQLEHRRLVYFANKRQDEGREQDLTDGAGEHKKHA